MSGLNAQHYLMLPWSIRGPKRVDDEHGNTHYEMRVGELPDFFVAGSTETEVLFEFKNALLAFIESYTNDDEEPPAPKGQAAQYFAFYAVRRPPVARVTVPADVVTAGSQPTELALV